MNDCIFCKIVKKEIPAEIIYEDEESVAFLDINPVSHGHTLVIPKSHHPIMTDVPDDLLGKLFNVSKKLMIAIKSGTNADFVVLSVVGIDVPHFHIHLIPRYQNDGLANFWPTTKYKDNEAKEVADKIRNHL